LLGGHAQCSLSGMVRKRLIFEFAAAVSVVLALAVPAVAQAPGGYQFVAQAGANGGAALYLPMGDLLNVRNVQGGMVTGNRSDLNLDLGAGDSMNRGDIVLNYDVGKRVLIYDGHKKVIAKFGPRGIVFYKRPRVVARP
jgi:hypothetical protein